MRALLVILFSVLTAFSGQAQGQTPASTPNPLANSTYGGPSFHPVEAKNGMVSAQEIRAAEIGRDILAQGGNAIDAAVATGFALSVTLPQAGNIGGGGFMLVALADQDEVVAIDFRETAPSGADRDMFLDDVGNVDAQRAQFSYLSAGVPGTVMGYLDALERYGSMSRRQVLAPAIRLADKGVPVSTGLATSLVDFQSRMAVDSSSVAYFYGENGQPLQSGDRLRQRDLAKTLKRIAQKGRDGFYSGKTADLIVAEMQRGGGLISHDDLTRYKTHIGNAVEGSYRGYSVYSMPPPSSGGVHIIQMLNMLEGYDLKSMSHNSADYLHVLIEVMRRAYADRSKYLGDPDYFDVPLDALTDKAYAAYLRETINTAKASRSEDILPAKELPYEGPQTTHFSVMDKAGNAVAVSTTINFTYGSGYSVDGAGFLLNNEMDDFSAKPGTPNGYGLVGGDANEIEAGKRPLSSMTPTLIKKDGKPYFVTGSPGGSTIITVVLQNLLNVIDFNMNAAEALAAPRIHHQWQPDLILVEPGISVDTLRILDERGFVLRHREGGLYERMYLGLANAVMLKDGYLYGAADLRSPTSSAAGY